MASNSDGFMLGSKLESNHRMFWIGLLSLGYAENYEFRTPVEQGLGLSTMPTLKISNMINIGISADGEAQGFKAPNAELKSIE